MKKYAFVICAALVVWSFQATAQDASNEPLKNKKGILILPQTGEWGLGVAANPFLSYAGNALNGNTFNNTSFGFTSNPANIGNNLAIFGKYVKNESTHYRARFNVSVNTVIDKAVVAEDQLNPQPGFPAFTEDWRNTNSQTVILAAGIEKRRGSTRVQGFYGAEVVLGYFGQNIEFQYGNPISADFTFPTTNNFGNNFNGTTADGDLIRTTNRRVGKNFLAGARGFIGVEYFFAPRISLGGEFGYMLAVRTAGRTLTETESWNNGINGVLNTKIDSYTSGPTTIGIGLDNLSGSINLLFYF